MKIQCDVCDRDEASMYCVADEAPLCDACDRHVHHANKLAGKHQRFSLHHSAPKQVPVCDICKEKRAFFFCQQDRAILCSDCDGSIHKASGHTQMHTRFLLTGLRVSATSSTYSSSVNSATSPKSVSDSVSSVNSDGVVSTSNSATSQDAAATHACDKSNGNLVNSSVSSVSESSISEYLIEMLPGWHFEDFLDSSDGFSKEGDNEIVLPLMDADPESNLSTFPAQKTKSWVPQVPLPPLNQTQNQSYQSIQLLAFGATTGTTELQSKGFNVTDVKSSRKWSDDSCFLVPAMAPTLTASKRQKSIW